MSGLDEISLAIGKLQSEADEARRHRKAHSKKLDEISNSVAVIPTLINDIKEIKPHINNFKKLKNRGTGIAIGLAVASGGVGAAFLKYLQSFTGNH